MTTHGLYKIFSPLFRSCSLLKKCYTSTLPKHLCNENFIISRNESSTNYSKGDFMNQYNATKARIEEAELPEAEVDPLDVFANNELDLSTISVYGFDYDYTLAVYKESLHYLIYDLGRDWLINKFKYPSEIRQLDYQPGFAIRGLHYDNEKGVLMKIDSFHQIQFESVYRGMTHLNKKEIIDIYGGLYISQEMIRGPSAGGSARMKQLNDLFSVPEICLISNVTEYFLKHNIEFHPEILSYDIQHAIQSIHPVMHKMLDEHTIVASCSDFISLITIDQYLEKHPAIGTFLKNLRSANKKMFLITNSPFKFVNIGMTYMIGSNWKDLFDLIVVQARKPKFFTDKSRPFRIYDPQTDSQLWSRVEELKKGYIYLEGNLKELQRLTGWCGHSVLYFGDQIYTDLADLTLHHGWRTGAIIYELNKEITILNSTKYRKDVAWLQSLQHMIEQLQRVDHTEDLVKLFIQERDELRSLTKSRFNKQFGSIFRTHHNPTYFSRRLFRYSDIYMSHLTNLLNYSVNHIFYPRRSALPHENYITSL